MIKKIKINEYNYASRKFAFELPTDANESELTELFTSEVFKMLSKIKGISNKRSFKNKKRNILLMIDCSYVEISDDDKTSDEARNSLGILGTPI